MALPSLPARRRAPAHPVHAPEQTIPWHQPSSVPSLGRPRARTRARSSVVWGAADFAGGSLSRRLPVLGVTLVSQAAGFVALIVAVLARAVGAFVLARDRGRARRRLGLAAFYRALSLGTMSVVSPIAACGALVPFALRSRPASGRRGSRWPAPSLPSRARSWRRWRSDGRPRIRPIGLGPSCWPW